MAKKAKKQVQKPIVSLKLLYIVLVLAILLVVGVLAKSYKDRIVPPKISVTQNQQVGQLKNFVDAGARFVEENGTEAFAKFKEPGAWNTDSRYIFVYDINGNTVVLPPQPELEGTNRLDASDSNGVYFVKEMINQAYNKDSGWVSYLYPKPGEQVPANKLSYFKKVFVGGKYYIVGSGVYLE
jgi:hypothetical protein